MPRGFFASSLVTEDTPGTLVPKCGACGLSKGCQSPKMPVYGQGRKNILLVGEAPGADEDDQGKPFVGKTGRHLQAKLRKLGIDMDRDCWRTNAIICRPPNNKLIDEDKKVSYCRPNLIQTLEKLKPTVVISLGGVATKSLMGWLWKPDPGGISRWLGWQVPSQRLNAWVCPTWHPSYLVRDERGKDNEVTDRMWENHLKTAISHTKPPWDEVPDYRSQVEILTDTADACSAIWKIQASAKALAFDFETDRLKPERKDSTILSCSLSDGKRAIAYLWNGKTAEATKSILINDIPKVGANIKFEQRWCLRRLGISVKNWIWDTVIAAHLLDNRPQICSVKFQAFVLLGFGLYNKKIEPLLDSAPNERNRLHEADWTSLLLYNGLDSLLEFKIYQKQKKLFEGSK